MEKKQISLRINKDLFEALANMADDDLRSINGEIEYILTSAVRNRKTKQDIINNKIVDYVEDNGNIQITLKNKKRA